jgi:hypothetical protein
MNWERLRAWASTLDIRDLSDEAFHWGNDEADTGSMPTDKGSLMAALSISFEAGRILERSIKAAGDAPSTDEFLAAIPPEVVHQVERWGKHHDDRKDPDAWFWLLGRLAGKGLDAHIRGDLTKALHHCITSAAVLAQWHASIKRKLGGGGP